MKLFATAVLLQKPSPGVFNLVAGYREAVSSAEAKGLALEAAERAYPGQAFVGVNAVEIGLEDVRQFLATKDANG